MMPTNLSRRTFLGLSAGAGAAAALSGCSLMSSGGGNGGNGSGLRVAWYGGDPVHKGMDTALAAYGKDHADVALSTDRAAFADYWDKLATQTAGGKGPDVFRMSMSYFSEYADRGALADLTQAVGSAIRTQGLDPDVVSSGEVASAMRGVGQSSISHATFCNPDLVSSVGGRLPSSWSWDSFADFVDGFAGETPDGSFGTTDAGGNVQIFEVYARQHGTSVFGPQGLAVGQDVVEEWFAYWDGLRRQKAAPPADVSAESTGFPTSLLSLGKAPVEFGWVQQVTFYQPLVKQPLVVSPVPGRTAGDLKGQFLKALDFWCVSSSSADQAGAERLVDFLVNDPRAQSALGLTLGVPPSPEARQRLDAAPDSAAGRAIAYVEKITDQVGPPPAAWPKGYGELQSTFTRLNQDIGFGRSDPARAAADFSSEAKRVLGE